MAEDKDSERSKQRQDKKWGRAGGSKVGTAHNKRGPEPKGDGSHRRQQRAAQKAAHEKRQKARNEAVAAVGGAGGPSSGYSTYDASGGGTVGITGGPGTTGTPMDIGSLLANAMAIREQREKERQRTYSRGVAPRMSNTPSLGRPRRTAVAPPSRGGGGGMASGGGGGTDYAAKLDKMKYDTLMRGPIMEHKNIMGGLGSYTVRNDPLYETLFGQGAGVSVGQAPPILSAAEDLARDEPIEPWTLGGGGGQGDSMTEAGLAELLAALGSGGTSSQGNTRAGRMVMTPQGQMRWVG